MDHCSLRSPGALTRHIIVAGGLLQWSAMISDLDIWRAANLLIRQHGENAEIIAAHRADELLERGDLDGEVVWLRIKRAVGELQSAPVGPPH